MIPEEWKGKFVRIFTDNGTVSLDGILEEFSDDGLRIEVLSEPVRHVYITIQSLSRVELIGDRTNLETYLQYKHKNGRFGTTISILFLSIGVFGVSYAIASSVKLDAHEYLLFVIGLMAAYIITSVPVWIITENRLRSKIISLSYWAVLFVAIAIGFMLQVT